MHADNVYRDLVETVLTHGEHRADRTGTGTKAIFGHQMRFDLREGFPLLTTKKMFWNGIVDELFWFLQAKETMNLNDLPTRSHNLWKWWARDGGDLGAIYGSQWRHWGGDQLQNVIASIKSNPMGRRHIVSAWNVMDIESMALPPCHVLFQFYVGGDSSLSLQLYQRSGDVFLGIPFNIASYSLLLTIVAKATGLTPKHFVHTIGDAHIYLNHVDQLQCQISRSSYPMPTIEVADRGSEINSYTSTDVTLQGYLCHPSLKGSVAV